jgi:hypothetical protein
MTKEELYGKIGRTKLWLTNKEILDVFFDSNICIPKGSNRHPYADVWHEWAEDTNKEIQLYGNDGVWYSPIAALNLKACIKPSEPTFEWQWIVHTKHGYIVSDNGRFMTLEETCDGMLPIEETKRIRA